MARLTWGVGVCALLAAVAGGLVLTGGLNIVRDAAMLAQGPAFARGEVTFARQDGTRLTIPVEIARSLEEKTRGLMFRRHVPRDYGMLFVWGGSTPVSMWMKNTYVSLDMVFFDTQGRVVKVLAHAVPLSLVPLSSDLPARGVIEMAAGEAERLGIKPGDHIQIPETER